MATYSTTCTDNMSKSSSEQTLKVCQILRHTLRARVDDLGILSNQNIQNISLIYTTYFLQLQTLFCRCPYLSKLPTFLRIMSTGLAHCRDLRKRCSLAGFKPVFILCRRNHCLIGYALLLSQEEHNSKQGYIFPF